nr:hypothetical protein [Tanacetum cinerariifolium]
MFLEESNDLNILDAEPVDLVLEASSLPKFDMHLHKSSVTDTYVKWLTTCYGISVQLYPRVASKGMTMDTLPNDAIRIYAHHFQQGVNRATYFEMYCRSLDITPTVPLFRVFYKLCKQGNWDAPIDMAWRHHDSIVANPFPKPSEYDALDVAKLCEVVIALHKPPPSFLYVACLSHVWKHASRAFSLKDPKGKGNTFVSSAVFFLFVYSLLDLPPKTSDMVTAEIPCWKVLDDKEKKKRKVEAKAAANAPDADIQVPLETSVRLGSEHVSSPVHLNHDKLLESLANEEYVSPNALVSRMGALRNQTDESATHSPIVNADKLVTGGEGTQDNVDATFANEGHGDNEGGFSGLRTQHSHVHHLDLHLDSVRKPTHDVVVPDAEASKSSLHSLFTLLFLLYNCMPSQVIPLKAFAILLLPPNGALWIIDRVEELEKEKAETKEVCMTQADRIKQLEAKLKQFEIDAHHLRVDRERYAVECGNGEMAILTATPNVDPASPDIFMETCEKIFDKRYPYVDKVARVYLLDPSSLQNVMPDETGPTPGGGPRNTPTASYA